MIQPPWESALAVWAARDLLRRPGRSLLLFAALASVPLLMTLLLLKVSGVVLLEKDIGERRPDYASYIRRTNAFIPGKPANKEK